MIRRASPCDIDAIFSIEKGCDDGWSRDSLLSMLAKGYCYAYVVVVDGLVVGYLLGMLIGDGGETEGEVLRVAVYEEFRGNGYGASLMKAFLESGGVAFFLEVACDNESAVRLYEGLGFTHVRRIDNYYGRNISATSMKIEVKGGSNER